MSQPLQLKSGLMSIMSGVTTPVGGAESHGELPFPLSLQGLDSSFSSLFAASSEEMLSSRFQNGEITLQTATDSEGSGSELPVVMLQTEEGVLPGGKFLPLDGQLLPTQDAVVATHFMNTGGQNTEQLEASIVVSDEKALDSDSLTGVDVLPLITPGSSMSADSGSIVLPVGNRIAGISQEKAVTTAKAGEISLAETSTIEEGLSGKPLESAKISGETASKSQLLTEKLLAATQNANKLQAGDDISRASLSELVAAGGKGDEALEESNQASLARLQSIPVSYRSIAGAAVASTTVQIPVGTAQWGEAVAERMVWFSARNVSSAQLHLDPPELGPLQVRISTQNDQTTISFTSQHVAVREALDQNLPRLREIFAEQGLNLADVDVSEKGAEQQQEHGRALAETDAGKGGARSLSESDSQDASSRQSPPLQMSLKLVDYYV